MRQATGDADDSDAPVSSPPGFPDPDRQVRQREAADGVEHRREGKVAHRHGSRVAGAQRVGVDRGQHVHHRLDRVEREGHRRDEQRAQDAGRPGVATVGGPQPQGEEGGADRDQCMSRYPAVISGHLRQLVTDAALGRGIRVHRAAGEGQDARENEGDAPSVVANEVHAETIPAAAAGGGRFHRVDRPERMCS
jgi:hypothetical protein